MTFKDREEFQPGIWGHEGNNNNIGLVRCGCKILPLSVVYLHALVVDKLDVFHLC